MTPAERIEHKQRYHARYYRRHKPKLLREHAAKWASGYYQHLPPERIHVNGAVYVNISQAVLDTGRNRRSVADMLGRGRLHGLKIAAQWWICCDAAYAAYVARAQGDTHVPTSQDSFSL